MRDGERGAWGRERELEGRRSLAAARRRCGSDRRAVILVLSLTPRLPSWLRPGTVSSMCDWSCTDRSLLRAHLWRWISVRLGQYADALSASDSCRAVSWDAGVLVFCEASSFFCACAVGQSWPRVLRRAFSLCACQSGCAEPIDSDERARRHTEHRPRKPAQQAIRARTCSSPASSLRWTAATNGPQR